MTERTSVAVVPHSAAISAMRDSDTKPSASCTSRSSGISALRRPCGESG